MKETSNNGSGIGLSLFILVHLELYPWHFSIKYPVIGDPPSLLGTSQLRIAEFFVISSAITLKGALGEAEEIEKI